MSANLRICVVGLGYVGLPLAVGLSARFATIGFDIKEQRVRELRDGVDRNSEVAADLLKATRLTLVSDPAAIVGCDVYIITVPTPVDVANRPDLHAVREACRTIAPALRPGAIVVLESTVYPGVTEEVCGPSLEAGTTLRCGKDFFLGYSPERINPGDREHTIERIVKVVAGQTPEVAAQLAQIYGAINGGRIFVARSIRTAEAAKVIENAQRDVNIAFINEVTMIFNRIGLSIFDVLEAAGTKWNFLPFMPGLVGGHCIGVDPFYLADFAQRLHHHPEVILAGRRINDQMGSYVAEAIARSLAARGKASGARILVLGISFKENVPDLRNSKVIDIIRVLIERGHHVEVHDPVVDPDEAREEFNVEITPLGEHQRYDCLVGAVAHREFVMFGRDRILQLLADDGVLADVKGIWRGLALPHGILRWQL